MSRQEFGRNKEDTIPTSAPVAIPTTTATSTPTASTITQEKAISTLNAYITWLSENHQQDDALTHTRPFDHYRGTLGDVAVAQLKTDFLRKLPEAVPIKISFVEAALGLFDTIQPDLKLLEATGFNKNAKQTLLAAYTFKLTSKMFINAYTATGISIEDRDKLKTKSTLLGLLRKAITDQIETNPAAPDLSANALYKRTLSNVKQEFMVDYLAQVLVYYQFTIQEIEKARTPQAILSMELGKDRFQWLPDTGSISKESVYKELNYAYPEVVITRNEKGDIQVSPITILNPKKRYNEILYTVYATILKTCDEKLARIQPGITQAQQLSIGLNTRLFQLLPTETVDSKFSKQNICQTLQEKHPELTVEVTYSGNSIKAGVTEVKAKASVAPRRRHKSPTRPAPVAPNLRKTDINIAPIAPPIALPIALPIAPPIASPIASPKGSTKSSQSIVRPDQLTTLLTNAKTIKTYHREDNKFKGKMGRYAKRRGFHHTLANMVDTVRADVESHNTGAVAEEQKIMIGALLLTRLLIGEERLLFRSTLDSVCRETLRKTQPKYLWECQFQKDCLKAIHKYLQANSRGEQFTYGLFGRENVTDAAKRWSEKSSDKTQSALLKNEPPPLSASYTRAT